MANSVTTTLNIDLELDVYVLMYRGTPVSVSTDIIRISEIERSYKNHPSYKVGEVVVSQPFTIRQSMTIDLGGNNGS